MPPRRMPRTLLKSKAYDILDGVSLSSRRFFSRLRQVDVKAEHFERQVQRLEQEREVWEKKYEVRNIHSNG